MAVDPREAVGFFLNDPAKLDNPFPDFAYFRGRHPVFYYAPLDQWFVFGYDDVVAFFADPRLSSDRMKGFVDAAPPEVREDLRKIVPFLETWILMMDEPAHSRVRGFLHRGFNAEAIEALVGQIQAAVDDLLDGFRGRDGMDACGDFAFLLPAYVLSDFLGVHKADRARVIQWSIDFVDFFNIIPITRDTTGRLLRSGFEMAAYTRALIAERRATPRDDFLGVLVKAAEVGGNLTEDEIVGNTMLLLLAGHVAVRNLIGNVLWLLFTHPDQRDLLRARHDLLPNAIEESLRYETPVALIPRVALQDVDVRGNTIRRGQIVQLSLASANRDAAHFHDPERFDITRPPGRALSFGHGPHGCLGAHLALAQTRIAIETLFRRFPSLRLDESRRIVWYRNAGNRGPIALPVLF